VTHRRSLLAVVAVAFAVATVPAAAAAEAPDRSTTGALAASDANVTLSGTVTTTDERAFTDGYVVAVDEANASLAVGATPAELLAAAEADAAGVYAAQVDDGSYSLTLPSDGSYWVVATDGANASAAAETPVEGDTTQNLTVGSVADAETSLSSGSAGSTNPGDETRLLLRVRNTVPHVAGPFTATVGDLPEGWEITGNESVDGEWSGDEGTWQWSQVPVGERASGTLHVQIPNDTEPGTYEIPVTVTAVDDVVVYDGTWTLSVEEETTTTTTTDPGTTTQTDTMTTDEPTNSTTITEESSDGGSPGFGPFALVLALVLLAFGARRR